MQTKQLMLATMVAAVMACDNAAFNGPEALVRAEQAGSSSNVYTFGDMANVGSSHLNRTPNGVNVTLSTTGLASGYAYTVWWVVFDRPDLCQGGVCGEADVIDALTGGPNLAEVAILGAADGKVVGGSGRATFAGRLPRGDASTSIFGGGLDNVETAEIHMVIRSHGPKIPGLVSQQISTFNGGCEAGQPNECIDVQFAVHQAN